MKSIVEAIIISLVCLLVTAIIILNVVIPNPKDITSYLALSFAAVLDGIWLCVIIPFRPREKPKTVSKPLVFWLLVVLYCCLLASGFLTDACLSSLKIFVLVFDCIFAAMGLAAVATLIYMLIEHLIIRYCLKHGEEATAEFICAGKFNTFEYGKPQTKSYHAVFRYSVVFKYAVNGQEKTATSKRVFSYQEVEQLQSLKTFNIKYNKHLAVISEILNEDKDNNKQQND